MAGNISVKSKQERILYIEDHKDSREMLAEMLSYSGYTVATATTVADSLTLARRDRFDLYILDSRFPDGTGVDLCRRIRLFDPNTPIIFFSSAAYKHDIEAGIAAGAQAYLTKPTGIYLIVGVISRLLAGISQIQIPLNLEDPKPGLELARSSAN